MLIASRIVEVDGHRYLIGMSKKKAEPKPGSLSVSFSLFITEDPDTEDPQPVD